MTLNNFLATQWGLCLLGRVGGSASTVQQELPGGERAAWCVKCDQMHFLFSFFQPKKGLDIQSHKSEPEPEPETSQWSRYGQEPGWRGCLLSTQRSFRTHVSMDCVFPRCFPKTSPSALSSSLCPPGRSPHPPETLGTAPVCRNTPHPPLCLHLKPRDSFFPVEIIFTDVHELQCHMWPPSWTMARGNTALMSPADVVFCFSPILDPKGYNSRHSFLMNCV